MGESVTATTCHPTLTLLSLPVLLVGVCSGEEQGVQSS